MPTIPKTQMSPTSPMNLYQHHWHQHPGHSPNQNQLAANPKKHFNLTDWLTTAQTNPPNSPIYLPENDSTITSTLPQQQQLWRTNPRNQWQTPLTPIKTPTTPITQTAQTPTEHLGSIQTTLDLATNNLHWGGNLHPIPENNFWILSKNSNWLPTTDHYAQWRAAAAAAQDSNTNVLCLQETNLRWENNNHQAIQQIFWKSHEVKKSAFHLAMNPLQMNTNLEEPSQLPLVHGHCVFGKLPVTPWALVDGHTLHSD